MTRPLLLSKGKTNMKNNMSARIGDLAVASFDDNESCVCLITGRTPHGGMTFVYSPKRGEVATGELPKGRLQAISFKPSPSNRLNLRNMYFTTDRATGKFFPLFY